jgi:HAD superfamily hydrolase (TIGR01509 family)
MRLDLPAGDFKAYLFDCDGTVVDSMPVHYIAWRRALDEYGASFTEEQFYGWGGLPAHVVIERLNAEQGLAMNAALVAERKEEFYYEFLPQLVPVPEVLDHVLEAHGRIPIAIVSGSTRESVVASLTAVGLLDRFDTLVCAGDYAKGKPDPEPFLLAAARLGVAPAHCLVFEDAEPGIQSAIAASMGWVRVAQPHERKEKNDPVKAATHPE